MRCSMWQYFQVSKDSVDARVAIVALHRPKKLNAFCWDSFVEISNIFKSLDADPSVRSVLLCSSTHRAFMAGLDLTCPKVQKVMWPPAPTDPPLSAAQRGLQNINTVLELQGYFLGVGNCSKPVVCAIQGMCFGLGVDLACMADIRIASHTAAFSVREVKLGICADIGTLQFLPHIVGNDSWVRDVALTGRVFSASEAHSVGFLSSVCPDDAETIHRALLTARQIAENPPIAVLGTKHNLNVSRGKWRIREAMEHVAVWNAAMLQDSDTIAQAAAALLGGKSKL